MFLYKKPPEDETKTNLIPRKLGNCKSTERCLSRCFHKLSLLLVPKPPSRPCPNTAHGSQLSQLVLFLNPAEYETLRWHMLCLFRDGSDALGLVFSSSLRSTHSYIDNARRICFHWVCSWQTQLLQELLSSSTPNTAPRKHSASLPMRIESF